MMNNFKDLKTNDSVLIHGGSGSVGNMLLQIGKSKGLRMVATGSAKNHGSITKYGAKAVDYKSSNYFKKLKQSAEDGFDAVFDFTNHKSFNNSFGLLKKEGILLTYGILTKASQIEKKTMRKFLGFGLSFGKMLLKLVIWNALPNGKSAHFYDIKTLKEKKPEQYQNDLESLVLLLAEGQIVPEIRRTYDISKIQSAHKDLESPNVVGSLILVNSD